MADMIESGYSAFGQELPNLAHQTAWERTLPASAKVRERRFMAPATEGTLMEYSHLRGRPDISRS